MYRSNYPFGTEHEIPELENSLPFPPNSYFALLEVIKIHHVGGGLGFEDDSIRSTGHRFRVYADRRTIRCLYSKGRVGGRGGRGVALQGVGGMNRNLGENFIVYSRRVSTYKCLCHREGNSECKEGEEGEWEGGEGCSVPLVVLRRGKRMPRRWMRARRKSLHFIAGLKGLQSNA